MVRKLKLRKGKKQWFTVVAPEIYKEVEIGEITAYEPKELPGRKIALTQAQVTSNPRDSQKNLEFKVAEVKGTKAHTVPWKFYLQNSYIQRISRKYRSRFIVVKYIDTQDKLRIKLKLYALMQNKITNTIKAALINQLIVSAENMFGKYKAYDLFVPGNFDKMSVELKNELIKIYPLSKILVWKATVV